MKLSTFSTLFVILASTSGTSHSASNLVSDEPSTPLNTPTMAPSVEFALLDLDLDPDLDFDPSGGLGRLSLLGLDPSKPLTDAEAFFLEATIREVFNNISKDMGIDLVADSVSVDVDVAKDAVVVVDADNKNNLQGNRKLPWNDREMCTYQTGPNVGESIPGCIFDIDFYMDCYCHLCRNDDFIWDGNKITNPTLPPIGFKIDFLDYSCYYLYY